MYRIYDSKEKKWVREGIYLSPNNDLSKSNKSLFGYNKLNLVPDCRYTYQNDIGLFDKKGVLIFEGDILKSESGLIGLVAYVPEKAAYLFLDYNNTKYYPLGSDICKQLSIIGNNFENPELVQEGSVANGK